MSSICLPPISNHPNKQMILFVSNAIIHYIEMFTVYMIRFQLHIKNGVVLFTWISYPKRNR